MYLEVVLIDVLQSDGILKTYRYIPKHASDTVVTDRLEDIDLDFKSTKSMAHDRGSVRIYNSNKCSIDVFDTKPKKFTLGRRSMRFELEHMGIPLGSSRDSRRGIYNFLLGSGWRLTNLYVSDPYDNSTSEAESKRQFERNVYWDTKYHTQAVDILISSQRGSFSFILGGSAELYEKSDSNFIPSAEGSKLISSHYFFEGKGRKEVIKHIV
jgi:hypothetical protein